MMYLIDLDTVNWQDAPVEFLEYATIGTIQEWLRKQPAVTAYVLIDSQHPLVKAKALEAAMDMNRFVMDMAQLLTYKNAEKKTGGNK